MDYTILISTTFGLEAVVKRELMDLGYDELQVENGRIILQGNGEDVAKLNLWLRCAERIFIQLAKFPAVTFEELFQGVYALPWPEYLPKDANFIVNGRSHDSKLFSISDCQRITEKAIIEKMRTRYPVDWFEKSGATYEIEIEMFKDVATLTLNTSGEGLHKRGYRDRAGDAPIKETLAAAMLKLSFWHPSRTLWDPFCGSGTIAIEAAMMGRNIAPGLDRNFDAEKWEFIGKETFSQERKKAFEQIDNKVQLDILGCDTDKRSILRARDNATNVGLNEDISFFMKDMRDVDLPMEYGVIVTNPPYGVRMSEQEEVFSLYRDLGKKMAEHPTWSVFVITSEEDFEKLYGKRADRKRKLYNGRIKTDYYQFYGPRPPKNYYHK